MRDGKIIQLSSFEKYKFMVNREVSHTSYTCYYSGFPEAYST